MEQREAMHVRWCAWSCVAFLIFFGCFWGLLGQNIPPFPPSYPTDQLAAHFLDNAVPLRVAFAVAMFGCTFYMTWTVGLFCIMRKMERGTAPMSYVQLMGGSLTALVPMLACLFWLAAAFRPETDPQIIRLLYDLGWLTIDLGFGVTLVQYVALAVLVLRDERIVPLFPRWVGWLGVWIASSFLAELIMPLFRSGPFSWSGLFGYWIPFFVPFAWFVAVIFYMLRATRRLESERISEVSAHVPDAGTKL